ncbi:MAG: type II/IV secretion system ATPase subunit [Candidatus Methanoperedens sp.]
MDSHFTKKTTEPFTEMEIAGGKNLFKNRFLKKLEKKLKEEYYDLRAYLHILLKSELTIEPYSFEKFGPLIIFDVPDGYVEIERHWVNEPYVYISILFHEINREYLYYVVEPKLSQYELMVLETVYENILDTLKIYETSEESKVNILEKKILELIDGYSIEIDGAALHKIMYYIKRDYIGYEKIDGLIKDPDIEDISCDGEGIPIFVYHRKYQNIKTNLSFSAEILDSFVVKLSQRSGKHISIGEPIVNSTLPDGSRLNVSLGKEIMFRGSSFTIRKFQQHAFTPVDLIKNGTYSVEMLAYLWLAVENGKSMIFAGATAAGKTSALNAISLFIPPLAKIVSIEDTHELKLHHSNWIGNVTRESFIQNPNVKDIDMYELLRQALRQRPEYIIVGEIRGKEGITLFQSMNTGHTTYSTMHAETINTVLSRLEGEPINVPRVMIQALDILCIQKLIHLDSKRVRRLDMMIEIVGIDPHTQDLRFNDIFSWDPRHDSFNRKGKSYVLESIMKKRVWSEKELESELAKRKEILNYMVHEEMDEYSIASFIQGYYVDPNKIMGMVRKEYESTP